MAPLDLQAPLRAILVAFRIKDHAEDGHVRWLRHIPMRILIDVHLVYDHQVIGRKRRDVLPARAHRRERSLIRTSPDISRILWYFPRPPKHSVAPASCPTLRPEFVSCSKVRTRINAVIEESGLGPQCLPPHAARNGQQAEARHVAR